MIQGSSYDIKMPVMSQNDSRPFQDFQKNSRPNQHFPSHYWKYLENVAGQIKNMPQNRRLRRALKIKRYPQNRRLRRALKLKKYPHKSAPAAGIAKKFFISWSYIFLAIYEFTLYHIVHVNRFQTEFNCRKSNLNRNHHIYVKMTVSLVSISMDSSLNRRGGNVLWSELKTKANYKIKKLRDCKSETSHAMIFRIFFSNVDIEIPFINRTFN